MRFAMEQRSLTIEGMSCGHCVARVKKTLEAVAGVTVSDVQIGSARLAIQEPAVLAEVIRALDDAGYPAREA
jgi:copper chaperone CopZ